jgi:lauroyl/myristoyl acyltransferase
MGLIYRVGREFLRWTRIFPKGLAWQTGRGLGAFFGSIPSKEIRRCRSNLTRAFPELTPQEIRQRTKQVFAHFGGMALETPVALHDCPSSIGKHVTVHGVSEFKRFIRGSLITSTP